MSNESTIFADMEEILRKIHIHIERIEQTNREIAEALRLLSTLQEKIIAILKDIHAEVKDHSTKLDEHTKILKDHSTKLDEHTKILKDHSTKLDEHTKKLDDIRRDIRDIKEGLRRLIGELEDEAKEIVALYLRSEYDIKVRLETFRIEKIVEVNIYGCTDDLCVIGECKNRIGPSVLLKVCMNAIKLAKHRPNALRRKIILVVYGIHVVEIAKKYALRYGICIITPKGIITEPKIHSIDKIRGYAEELKKVLTTPSG